MAAYVFPGQGSQMKGMGKDLFPEFSDLIAKANITLGYSLEIVCLEDPYGQLDQTQYTQPVLYTINALLYFKKLQETGKKPDFVAGHSLGEYNALLAADVFDFETGLKLVKKRGELMSQATDGAMAAIIGVKEDLLKELINRNNLLSITVANYNSFTQMVISGKKPEIEQACIICEQAGATLTVPLKVSGAFHSSYMQAAEVQFRTFLNEFQFATPTIPVIANYNARPYANMDDEIKKNLAAQITNPVRWTESIEYLIQQGISDFVEVGPNAILSGLIRRIKNRQ